MELTIRQLLAEETLVIREKLEEFDEEKVDVSTGEVFKYKVYRRAKHYFDPRKFVKTFNPVISKLVKDFEGDPKAQSIFMLMSFVEDNKEVLDINLSYKEFTKICNKHDVKLWTRAQLSNCLKWLVDKEYLFKLDGSNFRINYRFLYNGSLTHQLGIDKAIPDSEVNALNTDTYKMRSKLDKVSFSNISDTDDDLS